jgi:hypothetical protein
VVQILAKDFVVPQMALEGLTVTESWQRLLLMLKAEKGQYAGYVGLKIVMAIGAAMIFGIVATIVILIVVIPVGGFGAITVLLGKAAGLTWNAYTITLAILAGCALVLLLLYAISLISVPAIVFFPAYSIYFFASRYPRLEALLHPAPLAVQAPPPPEPPRLFCRVLSQSGSELWAVMTAAQFGQVLVCELRSCFHEKRRPRINLTIR